MQTETIVEEVGVDVVKSSVMLQLIGAATGQRKVLSVRALYANARKYGDCNISYGDFLQHLDAFREELDGRDGELGVDVNYIGMKTLE